MIDRRGFLKAIPFAAASMSVLKFEGEPDEAVFRLPDNMKKFNGGCHKYLRDNGTGEVFLPAGVWKMTEIRFVKIENGVEGEKYNT